MDGKLGGTAGFQLVTFKNQPMKGQIELALTSLSSNWQPSESWIFTSEAYHYESGGRYGPVFRPDGEMSSTMLDKVLAPCLKAVCALEEPDIQSGEQALAAKVKSQPAVYSLFGKTSNQVCPSFGRESPQQLLKAEKHTINRSGLALSSCRRQTLAQKIGS